MAVALLGKMCFHWPVKQVRVDNKGPTVIEAVVASLPGSPFPLVWSLSIALQSYASIRESFPLTVLLEILPTDLASGAGPSRWWVSHSRNLTL
jgi:hypothetical protein